MPAAFEVIEHEVDFCVVGGGMAGLIAAVSAARHGARVALMQDRSVLGGNASSEIRMWICGARGAEAKETGLLEEILLRNLYRNRSLNYSLWDNVLYEFARYQEGLLLLLNTACHEVYTEDGHIVSIKGWQTTTQRFHLVKARLYADCSGDSVLRVSGAQYLGDPYGYQLDAGDGHLRVVRPGCGHSGCTGDSERLFAT